MWFIRANENGKADGESLKRENRKLRKRITILERRLAEEIDGSETRRRDLERERIDHERVVAQHEAELAIRRVEIDELNTVLAMLHSQLERYTAVNIHAAKRPPEPDKWSQRT